MTANAVKVKFGPKGGRSPYFPLYDDPQKVGEALDSQIKGLRAKHPDIAAAFERHQPYQAGKSELGYLHQLARVNKHQDFTPQTRTVEHADRYEAASGATIELGHGSPGTGGGEAGGAASISMGPGASITLGDTSIQDIEPVEIVYVDWLFVDPPVSVLTTLEALAGHVRSAVEDIAGEAGL